MVLFLKLKLAYDETLPLSHPFTVYSDHLGFTFHHVGISLSRKTQQNQALNIFLLGDVSEDTGI